jgi:hypothetical protein
MSKTAPIANPGGETEQKPLSERRDALWKQNWP